MEKENESEQLSVVAAESVMEEDEIAVTSEELTQEVVNTSALPVEEQVNLSKEQVNHYQARYQELEELLEFAAENGKLDPPDLAIEVKQLKKVFFYTPPNLLPIKTLCYAEAKLERLYAALTELVSPVTVLTLRTTSDAYAVYRPGWKAVFLGSSTVGRNFFRQLFWVAMLLIGLICFRKLTMGGSADPLNFIDPFLYGALGALVYLYKNLTDLYTKRTLHPKKLATNWLRLFMGALTGALIVNLFMPFFEQGIAGMDVPHVAIGFLAGYSVEFFYQALDKIINLMTPQKQDEQTITPTTPRQMQIEILTKRLKEMSNEEDKVAIRKLLEKM